MEVRWLARAADTTREPLSATQVESMARRVLGPSTQVTAAIELGLGSYNTTLRIEPEGGSPLVLRVAPRPEQQLRSERHWLRSEHAAGPWLSALGPLVPRLVGADFTHQVIGRDYLVQTLLPGVPAPDLLPRYDRALWPGFFAQLGAISARIHQLAGPGFGPLHAPADDRWSVAVGRSLRESSDDLARWSLPVTDVDRLVAVVDDHRDRLESPGPPRLLHGDLWTANVLLHPTASEPEVVGVVDSERSWWGDPLADWALYRADARASGAERDAFWNAYGGRPTDPDAGWRLLFYRGRHLVAERVEAARLGHHDRVAATESELAQVLAALG